MIAAWGALSLAAAAAGEAEQQWALVVEAERVEAALGRVQGWGDVRLTLDGNRVVAESFRYETASGLLVLERGEWRPSGGERVTFDEAWVALGSGGAVFTRARYDSATLRVTAARVEVTGERLSGTGAVLTACGCDPPPWSLEARQVEVVAGDHAEYRGAWVRVCDLRLLPVPDGSVPLAPRRSGLLPPEVGWGADGPVVGLPVMLVPARWTDVVVEPEWRRDRGFRALSEARATWAPGEAAALGGAAGYDVEEGAWRGAVDLSHGWTPGRLRTAVAGQWTSDQAYLADFGDDYLDRAAPWSEVLAVAGAGTARLETDLFQADDPVGQRLVGGVFSTEGQRLGPFSTGAYGRVDVAATGAGALDASGAVERFAAGLHAEGGRDLGPVRWTGGAGGTLRRWGDGLAWVEGRGALEATVPAWGEAGGLVHLAEPGVRATASALGGEADPRLPDEVPAPAWAAGPSISSRWVAAGGTPVSATAWAPWTADGFRPFGQARYARAAWEVRAAGDRDLQEGRVGWTDEVLAASAGAARLSGGSLLQASAAVSGQLPGPLRELRPGYRALADLAAGRLVSHGPTLRFDSRCRCLSATASATWSADRDAPDFALAIGGWRAEPAPGQ